MKTADRVGVVATVIAILLWVWLLVNDKKIKLIIESKKQPIGYGIINNDGHQDTLWIYDKQK
jgi:hypothetical protein